MNGHEADAAIRAIPYPHNATKDTRRQLKAEYDAAVDAVVAEFKDSLAQAHANKLPKSVQDRIWDKAWNDYRSNGYGEVEMGYEELADLVDFAVRASR